MATNKLDPSKWQEYFDDFSRRLPVVDVEIEVTSIELGDQRLAEWAPLEGISFDPNDRSLLIGIYAGADHIDHRVPAPREIHIEEEEQRTRSIAVIDNEGNRQIIRFRKALKLPSGRLGSAEAESALEQGER